VIPDAICDTKLSAGNRFLGGYRYGKQRRKNAEFLDEKMLGMFYASAPQRRSMPCMQEKSLKGPKNRKG